MRRKLTFLVVVPGLLGFIQPAAAEPPLPAGPSAAGPAPVQAAVPDGPEAGTGPLRAGVTAAAAAGDTLDALLREAEERVRALSQARGGAGGADPAAAARTELALARERIAALEAARAEDGATIARLRAEAEQLRGRVQRLSQELDASWQWVEELNAVLASLGARSIVPDAGAAGAGEARAEPPIPTALASPAPRTAAASPIPLAAMFAAEPQAADRDDETPAAAADAQYTVVRDVNLRAAPRITADVVTVMERGALVRRPGPLESERGWLRVTYTDRAARELTGWVFEDFLRPVNGPTRTGDARSGAGG